MSQAAGSGTEEVDHNDYRIDIFHILFSVQLRASPLQ